MLFRRITEHVKAQNWTAVALDFVIVVLGVFMGIQLGNWNERVAERGLERSALERLTVEYNNNLKILAEDREKAVRALTATKELLSMIAPAPDPNITDESVAQLLMDCMQNAKFVPTLGVTNSLTASGEIRLIGDPEIQRLLSQWPSTVQYMAEWQDIERNHGEELILGLTYDYLAWPNIDNYLEGQPLEKSALESDYQGLFSSKRFEGLLHNRRYNTAESIRRMDEVRAETQTLIALIETRLEGL